MIIEGRGFCKMKKGIFIIMAAVMLTFSSCGKTRAVERIAGESNIYSESEINSAMDSVVNKFKMNFHGCELLKLEYSDDYLAQAKGWAEEYGYDEAIVLLSEFKTGDSNDGSLGPNSVYSNYQWILVRNEGGKWKIKNWGYG